MATNFLVKKQQRGGQPASYLTGGGPVDQRDPRRNIVPIHSDSDTGFVPVDLRPVGDQEIEQAKNVTAINKPPVFSNAPSPTDNLTTLINTPLAQLPSFQRAMQARASRIALEAMPTYVNKRGETVQGMEDKDGRLQSGLKGLVQGLAEQFGPGSGPTRDWGDLLAKTSGAITRGVGGAIVPEWNEWQDRQIQIARARKDEQDAIKGVEFESKMLTQATNREDKLADNTRQQKSLDDRIARHKMQNMKDEQKMLLEPIFKRGYYYEGDNPAEDEALAKSKVILPDFDNSRKPIVDNGVKKAWNPEKRSYEPVQGSEADPDDAPMTFYVDGEKVTASTKYFVNYKAGMEKQKNQQTFQAGENDKNRQVQWARIKQAAEQFRAKNVNEFTQRAVAIKKSLEAGDISPEEANQLLTILNTNNPSFKQE